MNCKESTRLLSHAQDRPLRLRPWEAPVRKLAAGPLDPGAAQARVFEAQRALARNPAADALLREVAQALA